MTRTRRGFTLFELMVVLVILAITAAAAVPAYTQASAASAEKRIATEIADALVATRDAARESGSPASFVLSPSDGRFWVTTRTSSVTGVVTTHTGASIESGGHDRIECRFDPAGTATPLEITVKGVRPASVTVDRWSSDVHVDERTR